MNILRVFIIFNFLSTFLLAKDVTVDITKLDTGSFRDVFGSEPELDIRLRLIEFSGDLISDYMHILDYNYNQYRNEPTRQMRQFSDLSILNNLLPNYNMPKDMLWIFKKNEQIGMKVYNLSNRVFHHLGRDVVSSKRIKYEEDRIISSFSVNDKRLLSGLAKGFGYFLKVEIVDGYNLFDFEENLIYSCIMPFELNANDLSNLRRFIPSLASKETCLNLKQSRYEAKANVLIK